MELSETVTVPEFIKKRSAGIECDLCKTRIERASEWPAAHMVNWGDEGQRHFETAVSLSCCEGGEYGGETKETFCHICPSCFKTFLLPWLESQGVRINTNEIDW